MKKSLLNIFTACFMIVISFSACQKKPEACFEVATTTVESGKEISFSNCSQDADNYEWDFGDGNTSKDQNPTHIYENSGTYTATLTALSENKKKSAQITKSITVTKGPAEQLSGEWDVITWTEDGTNQLQYDQEQYVICATSDTVWYFYSSTNYITLTVNGDEWVSNKWVETIHNDDDLSKIDCQNHPLVDDDYYTSQDNWTFIENDTRMLVGLRYGDGQLIPYNWSSPDTFEILSLSDSILEVQVYEHWRLFDQEVLITYKRKS